MKAHSLIESGRFVISRRYPDFSQYVLALKPRPNPQVRTFAVDQRWNLFYNEETVAQMQLEHVASTVLHHVMHLACRHHRLGARIQEFPQLYAMCACLSVNSYIS